MENMTDNEAYRVAWDAWSASLGPVKPWTWNGDTQAEADAEDACDAERGR